MTRFFCSEESRGRAEPLYATAPRVRTWLLVEYPGIWRPDAIEESTFPDLVKERLAKLCKTEPLHRQIFIRRSHQRSETMRCFVVRCSEFHPSIDQVSIPTCDGPIHTLDHPDAERVAEPMFLVCTHGNHDKCCAKWGLPLYHAARHVAKNSAWECSHIGGDRFAGNLVCFPHGIYYGHVRPDQVAGVIDSYKRGEVDLQHYRGRCCYPKAVQAAEYFIRKETGIVALDALRFSSVTRTNDVWQARFVSADATFQATLGLNDGPAELLTCKAQVTNPIPRFDLLRFQSLTLDASSLE